VRGDATKDARIYRRLAAWARCHEYRRVSRYAVHDWVKHKALPGAMRTYEGFGPPKISLPADTGRQLLALCRYRYDQKIGRLNEIKANLWLDGFDVPIADVRKALHDQLANARDRPPRVHRSEDSELDDRGAVAEVIARQRPIALVLPLLKPRDREDLTEEVLGLLEDGCPLSPWAKDALRRSGQARSPGPEAIRRPSSEALEAAIDTSDETFLAVRQVWGNVLEPLVAAGLPRSPRARSPYRLRMFLSALFMEVSQGTSQHA
jgi:hypothetical protein